MELSHSLLAPRIIGQFDLDSEVANLFRGLRSAAATPLVEQARLTPIAREVRPDLSPLAALGLVKAPTELFDFVDVGARPCEMLAGNGEVLLEFLPRQHELDAAIRGLGGREQAAIKLPTHRIGQDSKGSSHSALQMRGGTLPMQRPRDSVEQMPLGLGGEA